MSKSHDVFMYMGTYSSEPAAEQDLAKVKELADQGTIGTYDAAVVTREDGKVHMHKMEKPTRRGAWTGAAVGAVIGILFPPALIGSAVLGAAGGGLLGHFTMGMSRRDIKELGETLDSGEAALIVIARDRLIEQREAFGLHPEQEQERELDIEGKHLDRELAAANRG